MDSDNSFDLSKIVFSPTIAGYYQVNGVGYYFGKTSEWEELKKQLATAQEEIAHLQSNTLTLDGKTSFEFIGEELFKFQNATGCDTAGEYANQLAASQAREQNLLEALKLCKFDSLNMSLADLQRIAELTSKPSDTSALDAAIEKAKAEEREEIAEAARENDLYLFAQWVIERGAE